MNVPYFGRRLGSTGLSTGVHLPLELRLQEDATDLAKWMNWL